MITHVIEVLAPTMYLLNFLYDKNYFIWASEKDGYKHLHLHRNSGKWVRQIKLYKHLQDLVIPFESIDYPAKSIVFVVKILGSTCTKPLPIIFDKHFGME